MQTPPASLFPAAFPRHVLRAALPLLLLLALPYGCYRESVESTAPDVIPPLPPADLLLEGARDGYIFLSWLPNSEHDLDAYVVYRSEPASAAFLPIDTTTRSYIIDGQRSYDTTYTYRVTALDYSGNESAPSNAVSAQSPNVAAPDAPDVLTVAASNIDGVLRMDVGWDPADAYDLRGYVVYRSRSPQIQAGSDSLSFTEDTRFTDNDIAATGSAYFYAVAAVDRGGRVSSLPSPVSDFATDIPQLLSPQNASSVQDYPVFRWSAVRGALAYKLLLSSSAAGDQIWSATVNDSGADAYSIIYQGPSLATARSYYWRIATITKSGGPPNALSPIWYFQTHF